MRRLVPLLASALALAGCQTVVSPAEAPTSLAAAPIYPGVTDTQRALRSLGAPTEPVSIAVYGFTDQTGQFRPSDTGQTLSRAVSQGGASMLMRALQDAGQRRWFTVIEREQLGHLLNERQIIKEMRDRYLGDTAGSASGVPPLLFAGVLLEGGVVGYDSNTMTGGVGAGLLGISASQQYRQDTVTVYLRAVSVATGEVLTTITASKTIASQAIGANAFRYIAFKQLLEAEAGYTSNEPDQLALQQAIEKAVYGLVVEGADLGFWSFADAEAAWPAIWAYRQERDGLLTADQAMRVSLAGNPTNTGGGR